MISLFGFILSGLLFAQDASTNSVSGKENPGKVNPESNLPIGGGDQTTPNPEEAQKIPLVSIWDFVRMLVVLAGVVGVIYLIFFFIKKGAKRRFAENDLIEIIGSRDLAGGKALHLIKVGGVFLLIGVADGAINLITEISDKETIDAISLRLSEIGAERKKGFQSTLAEFFGAKVNEGGEEDTIRSSLDFMRKQRSRLDRLK